MVVPDDEEAEAEVRAEDVEPGGLGVHGHEVPGGEPLGDGVEVVGEEDVHRIMLEAGGEDRPVRGVEAHHRPRPPSERSRPSVIESK